MTAFNDTFGIIGFSSENVGIDRRIYTGLTSTNPQLNVSYNGGRVDVYLNGVKLMGNHSGQSNYDYTYQNTGSGSAITLSTGVALVATDTIECVGYVSNSSNTVTTYTPSVSAGNNTFTSISHTSSDLLNVFLNGVLLDPSDYTADASADTVAITSLASGDVVHIQVIGALDHSNFVPESGGTFSGDVSFGDNNKTQFGAGSDLQIYHDGSNSIIKDTGTGDLIIGGDNNVTIANSALTEVKALFTTDGASSLYYDNSSKIQTTATGINVTGDVELEATGAKLKIDATGNTDSAIYLADAGTTKWYIYNDSSDGDTLDFESAGGVRMSVTQAGDVTINSGNLIIGTAGQGIDFSNASGSNSGANSSVLDDYEEGDTQHSSFATTGGGSVPIYTNPAYNSLRYVKVGNVCTVHGCVIFSGSLSDPNDDGDLKIPLPFNAVNGPQLSGRSAGTFIFEGQAIYALICHDGQSYARVEGTGGVDTFIQGSAFSTGSRIIFSLTYTTV